MIEQLMQVQLGVDQIPHSVFIVIHLAILVIAVVLAFMTNKRGGSGHWTTAFSLVAVAEAIYILYHLKLTIFLLSHTIAEVLLLVAILLFFMGIKNRGATA